MSIKKTYGLIFIMMILTHWLLAQKPTIVQYTDQDGLPSMQTYQMIQDSTGLLWISTENGIVSFDGKEFVRFSHPDLLDNDIIEMSMNHNGRIYFMNLSQQLCYLENNEVSIIRDKTPDLGKVTIISKNGKDYLIVSKYWKKISYEIIQTPDNQFEFVLKGTIIYHSEEDKYYSSDHGYDYYCDSDSSQFSLGKDNKNHLISNKNYYAFKSQAKRTEVYNIDSALWEFVADDPLSILIKHDSNFFIIKNNNITIYNSTTHQFIPIFPDIEVNTLFVDTENNIWLSTPDNGLFRAPLFESQFDGSTKVINQGVKSILQDSFGNMYIGTTSSEVIVNPFGESKTIKITEKTRPTNLYNYDQSVFAYTEQGVILINGETLTHDTLKMSRISFKTIYIEDSILYTSIMGMYKNHYSYLFGNDSDKSQKNYLDGFRITELFKPKNYDTLYIGTTTGLVRFVKDEILFSKNKKLRSQNITCITSGNDQSIWVGTRSDGVLNIRNDSILNAYSIANGLISNSINNIEINGLELLVSTSKGLSIINLSTNSIKSLNTFNLLPSNNVLVCKVIEGKYWIGTNEGLTILSKEQVSNIESVRPNLTIKNMVINGIRKNYTANIALDHTENNIQINFQNISYKSGRDKSIKYRIASNDSQWTTTEDNFIRLPSLNPGKYNIEVVGINSVGTKSLPQTVSFTINAPWWETTWGRILLLIAFLSIVYALFRYRIRQETQKRNYLTQINKIKDQALQLQMNPHFIFNSLNAIQGFIGTDEEEMAMNYLARFARLIRMIFEHSKGNTITLEEELEFINLYLNLEKLRFKDKVSVEIDIDPAVENAKDIIHVPPLLIQPIVENSFKHGLFHKKGKGKLYLNYAMNDEIISITVKDNGIGRKQSRTITKKNYEKQESSGINTTLERIDLLNFGKEKKLNSVEITDLYDKEGNATGTKTVLNLTFN